MLEAEGLRLSLPDFSRKPVFGPPPLVDILKGVDVSIFPGEALGIVGESGSGKTTLGRTLVRLYRPTGGRIKLAERDITDLDEAQLRPLRPRFQMIFQDPQSSMNPRRTIREIVAQPLQVYGMVHDRAEARRRVDALLERVSLSAAHADRYPHELSGGQRQRVGIARAIALEPTLVVADEIVSGLDVSSQAQILALLRDLRADMGLALIFISHDLSVIRTVCDRVMVMLDGQAVESGSCAQIFAEPQHAYTRKLLDAIPLPDVDPDWLRTAPTIETGEDLRMDIKGSIALVSGANRGIGEAFVAELLDRGVAKIYAAARDPSTLAASDRVEPVELDVTKPDEVAAAAAKCSDVTLLINNAGVNFNAPLLAPDAMSNARTEIEVNYFGTLSMIRAFAPLLKANGGGCIVNMLSLTSRVNLPAMGSYAASKAAEFSMTQGIRAQLAGQGTLVVGIMPGRVDTRMTPGGEEKPATVAKVALDAVEAGEEDAYPGEMAQGVSQGLAADAKAVEKQFAAFLPE
jgi:ABC-type oligopeptide transport system ATPase subunit/NAD(P)-dependent dehydrogenase (short-subunit alcohol dehydrogenase family)